MKKLMIAALAVFAFAGLARAEFGLGVNFGAGQSKSELNDIKNDMSSYTHDKSFGFWGLEALYEQGGLFGLEQQHVLGAKLGYTGWADEKLSGRYGGGLTTYNYKLSYYEIPLTLYYKYAPSKWNFGGGLGMAYGKADDQHETVSKVYPFITAGAEYRFTKLFGLGLDMRYNMGAKLEKDDAVYKNLNGVQGALAARFYF